jgi:alkylation response protein AidB-like acyl-CoA dehydrogenase
MTDYQAPLDEISFALYGAGEFSKLQNLPVYEHASADMVDAILKEAGRFAEYILAPLNHSGDREGARLEGTQVLVPTGFAEAYGQFRDGGWTSLPFPADFGGQELPWSLALALLEIWNSANLSFALNPILALGAIEALLSDGTEAQKATYLEKLVSGRWCATMNLTEPQAGSDLGLLRARAERQGDSYRLFGSKIFISWGEHDCAENIVHMVLARLPDAPKGTRGISLFIVPKYLPDENGEPGTRNDIVCAAVEEKLGLHASPTCAMNYGEREGAVGFLLGKENEGLATMFTMMNNARLSVGVQGVAIAERAYQQALAYARERIQGHLPGAKGPAQAIARHPDVRRMLAEMKARTAASRALTLFAAAVLDQSKAAADEDHRALAVARLSLLTPIVKAFATDEGCRITSLGIQVHGGAGYIEETGAAQYYRDARVLPIYEGTNGIQAMDLVFRRVLSDKGQCARLLFKEIAQDEEELSRLSEPFPSLAQKLTGGRKALERATDWLLAREGKEQDLVAAAVSPFTRLFGLVLAAWLLSRSAALAQKLLEDKKAAEELPVTYSPAFLKAQIRLASLYCSNCLCEATALMEAAICGSADVLNFEDDFRNA